ncbi:MAG: SLBB domain-containing protein [Muribaculaceae bacterium]|nr:SLBB domain-containing protein [Muribaculaceae bacterium]
MRRILISLLMFCTLSAYALTDQQVIDYIKQQSAAGKSEQQIGKELLAKGVTPEQAKRIKAMYEAQQKGNDVQSSQNQFQTNGKRQPATNDRLHTTTTGKNSNNRNNNNGFGNNNNPNDFSTNTGLYPNNQNINIQEQEEDIYLTDTPERQIYGHQIFNNQSLTFEPSENLATPQNYRLGPGDEVIIDIWGTSEDHLRQTISPEGSIMISQLGPVYLNGMTINDANKHIKSAFSRKYAGMTDAETDIQVTLGQVRTIQVDIMGEVATPGTFQLSPFASVFHALYRAGGINDIGSLRNIQVLRNGKKIAGVDIYDYLFKGKSAGNIRLQEGDVIIVPPYEQLVSIDGNVKRPMYYEIKPEETVKSVLDYAGGFTGDAYAGMVRLSRQAGTENELYNIERDQFASYRLKDGDILTVGTILDRYANRVDLEGAVFRPGMYALNKNISTLGDLIRLAEGVTEDAYTDRVLIYREGPNLELQVIGVNLKDILAGRAADLELKRNDMIVIMSLKEIEERGSFTIDGQVTNPGTYPYAENTTVEDLIMMAGGLLEGASTVRIDVARRLVDPAATTQSNQISQVYTLSIENGLAVGNAKGFLLKPYDVVNIRKSPNYVPQETVEIGGEVLFGGNYVLTKRNERISDVVRRAGGLLESAYIKGAHMSRKLTEDEMTSRDEALRLAQANSNAEKGDSISMSKLNLSDSYNVGINLALALENPGSSYDLVLKPGDKLFIPEQQSTVKISGDVMFPNTVVYVPGKPLNYYIDQAGGYGQRAKKGKAFIVYMNGSVARAKKSSEIEPGCQIIVPSKPASNGSDWTKILAFATSFSSVAAMAATITNIFKK